MINFKKKMDLKKMNKAKFVKKSILIATISILAFSLIPVASAGKPGHMKKRPNYNNLFNGIEFSAAEDLYFRIGWYSTYEEIENDWFPPQPYNMKLFINDEEINLQRYGIPVPKELKNEIIKMSYWYHVFGPGYFTAGGPYTLRFEFWVLHPYQGDGLNYWRIYVDYSAEPDFVFSFEYDLNIVP